MKVKRKFLSLKRRKDVGGNEDFETPANYNTQYDNK